METACSQSSPQGAEGGNSQQKRYEKGGSREKLPAGFPWPACGRARFFEALAAGDFQTAALFLAFDFGKAEGKVAHQCRIPVGGASAGR